jgi:hypothetical protein
VELNVLKIIRISLLSASKELNSYVESVGCLPRGVIKCKSKEPNLSSYIYFSICVYINSAHNNNTVLQLNGKSIDRYNIILLFEEMSSTVIIVK